MNNPVLATEFRSQPRYKLNLELQFSYSCGDHTYLGTGRTKDFSDKVICFESDQDLPGGLPLELRIAWPVCLQGLLPLDMVAHGALVRKQRSLAVLRLEEFEFRTQGEGSFHARATHGGLCNVLA
jgi:hypothetical protein